MTKAKIEAIFDLTPMQQGMLYQTVSVENSTAYNIQMVFTLQGKLDEALFERCWQEIVSANTVLRSAFAWENIKKPFQVVNREIDIELHKMDFTGLSTELAKQKIDQFISEDMAQPVPLNKAPLMRLSLIREAQETYRFCWVFHHIILESWSAAILLEDFWKLYSNYAAGKTASSLSVVPYAGYVSWLKKQDKNKAEQYWKETLKGFTAATRLSIDRIPDNELVQVTRVDNCSLYISAEETSAMNQMVRSNRLTLNTLIQGMWLVLLSRYSGETDVVFGATVSGRPAELKDVERMVGMFVNVLPVRSQVEGNAELIPWLQALQLNQAEILQYEYSSLMQIKSNSEIKGGQPIYNTVLAFENGLGDFSSGEIAPGITISAIDGNEMSDQPITLLVDISDTILLRIKYDADRFDKNDIADFLKHYKALLDSVISDKPETISAISMLPAEERQQVLYEWNNTTAAYDLDQTLTSLFELQVDKTPDAIALEFRDESLSYAELDRRSNQLANYLREHEVSTGCFVGVFMERSIEMVVALYGILKAGAAYVPLDPDYPEQRIQWMLDDTASPVILTQGHLQDRIHVAGTELLCLDRDWQLVSTCSQARPTTAVASDELAYVIYTSGSTGKPKGVMNEHRGIVNRLLWMQERYHLQDDDRVLQKTPFSFDVSVWEFFWPLQNGARLIIAEPGGHKDPSYLCRVITDKAITVLHFVPSMLKAYLDSEEIVIPANVKRVLCSGEELPFKLQQQFFAASNAELHNLYGPTEAAIDVTSWQCRRDDDRMMVPIGRPVANTQIYILDPQLRPVPVGIAGELHIGGVQVARGYLNRDELTQERFIKDPFAGDSAQRLYKTGDLARFLSDGAIEYIGRLDHQVKLHGLRIELGEIETVLTDHPAIKAAVVIVREDHAGDQRLVAYTVSSTTEKCSALEVKDFLRQQLPEFMLPSAIVWLDNLPFTASGKIDRQALPAPSREVEHVRGDDVVSDNDNEATMIAIWEELLEIDGIHVSDSFFDLGGHSLLSLKVVEKFKKQTGISIGPASLVSQTLRQVVAQAEAKAASGDAGQENRGPQFLRSIKNVLSRNS